jgi:hypothetical protein
MSHPLPLRPEPIEGEVLAFSKTARVFWIVVSLFGFVVCFLMMAVGMFSGGRSLSLVLWFLSWVLVTITLGVFFNALQPWPNIVLGRNRMQVVTGRKVWFEVPYDNIAEIALFSRFIIPVGSRQFLGIKLIRPEEFDAAWPRYARARDWSRMSLGFDFAFWGFHLDEPLDRCLETMLTHYHSFQADKDSSSLPP